MALAPLKAGGAEDAAVRQQVRVPGGGRHADRHAGGAHRGACCANSAPSSRSCPRSTDYQAYAGLPAPINFNGLVRQYYLRSRRRGRRPAGQPGRQARSARARATRSRRPCGRRCEAIAAPLRRRRQGGRSAAGAAGAVAAGGRDLRPRLADAQMAAGQAGARACSSSHAGHRRHRRHRARRRAAASCCAWTRPRRPLLRHPGAPRSRARARLALAGEDITPLHDGQSASTRCRCASALPPRRKGELDALLKLQLRGAAPTRRARAACALARAGDAR
ncbi:MAG: hypothetical protein MZW92_43435 [Comamonadaceae bacterium]|nr:hypothetical protein [Comamonadaceae bacterium]